MFANRSVTTQPAVTDAIQLLATVRRLASRNRRRQVARRHIAILAVIACVAIAAFAWLANTYANMITDGVTQTLHFPIVIVVIVGWIAMNVAARQRRQSRRDAERSWLAALPLGKRAFTVAARRQVATLLAATLIFLLASLFASAWMLQLPSRSVFTLSLLLMVGATLGGMAGWTLARNDPRPARIRLPRSSMSKTEERFSLGRWPLRHRRAHADLALHARAIGLLLLSLPIGIPPLAVVAVIVSGLAALTIWDMSRALMTTTRCAGTWLNSLPLEARKTTLALGGRSIFVINFAAATILVTTALPMGMNIATAGTITLATGVVVVSGYVLFTMLKRPFGARR